MTSMSPRRDPDGTMNVAAKQTDGTDERPPAPRRRDWSVLTQRLLSAATLLLVVLAVAAVVLWLWPSDYDLYLPARGVPVDSQITITSHPTAASRGSLYMLYVYDEAITNKLEQLFGALNRDGTLIERYHPPAGTPDITRSQEQHISSLQMLTSETIAKIVAWSRMGYRFPVHGVEITGIANWSAARSTLQPFDVIVTAAGVPISSTTQLRSLVIKKGVGAHIPLVVERDDAQHDTGGGAASAGPCQQYPVWMPHRLAVTVPIVRNPQTPNNPAIGVGITQFVDISQVPRTPSICINPGNVGGPSAGLAFTLGILQRFSGTDLTRGHRIAVTGEIALDGSVAPIGGVKQKVIGARWAGAQYFILPAANYAEARPYAQGLTLVPVHTIDEALAFLKTLK